MENKLEAIKLQTAKESVADYIKRAILYGRFKPGQRLTEKELSEMLNVSRTPIREAFQRLEMEGLITFIPYRGVFVKTISYDEAKQTFEVRTVLEGLAVQQAVNNASDEDLKTLSDILIQMNKWYVEENLEQRIKSNHAFHEQIYKMAGNDILMKHLQLISTSIRLIRITLWQEEGMKDKTVKEHLEIGEAVMRRKGKEARALMEEHIRNVWQATDSFLSKSTKIF